MNDEGIVYVPEGVEVNLKSVNPGLIAGSAGCNGYSAAYFLDDGEISIGIPTRTAMACADEVMNVEDYFMGHIMDVKTAYMTNGKLVFADSSGDEIFVFTNSGEAPAREVTGEMADKEDVTGYTWHLYADPDKSSIDEIPEGVDVTLTFGEDGRLSGNSGCNNYFADYTLENGVLTIGMIGSTKMACVDDDAMKIEQEYLNKLGRVTGAYVDADKLFLLNENGVEILSFEKISPEGCEWTLTSYNDGEGGIVSVPADSEITLKLNEGQAGGNAGCNSYFGAYEIDEKGALNFGMIGMTEMYCEGKMDLESDYLSLIGETAGYTINGGVLTLSDSDGNTLLVFSES